MTDVKTLALRAKAAGRVLAVSGVRQRNDALSNIADALIASCGDILAANAVDMARAAVNNMRDSLRDRLLLTEARICSIAEGVAQIEAADDPLGAGTVTTRPNGLQISKVAVPLGLVGFIYEARPNVTADAAALCVKSGNAVLLRGSRDALNSNIAIANVIRGAIAKAGLPEDCVCLLEVEGRETVTEMMNLTGILDVLIPRGGAGFIQTVVTNSRVPVIETGAGICHVYADCAADIDMAVEIIYNAKCSRPSVCNAIEQLVVNEAIAEALLLKIAEKFNASPYTVEIRADAAALKILGDRAVQASDEDYHTEFGDYIIAVKTVPDLQAAIEHINATGTGHSEAIVTADYGAAQTFLREVDAAAVYVNASTRFTDGGEFGLGAEIGISTQKLHARGPMGLSALTSSKFTIYGNGQIR
ncbi:MAG: glutamate-5-semialdehyde dehydrogenase [Oscillospiraceae bacterium]|nr:glutamate-5-semialdehyde dehydrogenase [Oscillospiraceae bacterium]